MESGQPSLTALRAARARADHQMMDSPLIFRDPLATRIIGTGANSAAPTSTPMPAAVRLFMAIRQRLAEDALAAAVAASTHQLVILGAGLDTFAYRNPHAGLRVFEVDHPDTQHWKREILADTEIPAPDTIAYCGVDFDQTTLDVGLAGSGFDRSAPAMFFWLGVTPYLSKTRVLATLHYVVDSPARAEIVFDYNQPPAALPGRRQARLAALGTGMQAIGEPWLSNFTPDEMADELTDLGFRTIEDIGWDQCVKRYHIDESMPDLFGGRIVHAGTNHPDH